MEIVIHCSRIDGPREFHFMLAKALDFPAWYGNNLDALYDMLTSLPAETRLVFTDWDRMGPFSTGFRRVMEDAAHKNLHLTITYQ